MALEYFITMESRYFIIFYSLFEVRVARYLPLSTTAVTKGVYPNQKKVIDLLVSNQKAEGTEVDPVLISITNIIELSEADYLEFIK